MKKPRPRTKGDPSSLHWTDVAKELQDLLDLPLEEFKSANSTTWLPLTGTRVIHAIFDTVKAALLRGEDVEIQGFGKFKIIERKARTVPVGFVATDGTAEGVKHSAKVRVIPPKLIVKFFPSPYLTGVTNLNRGLHVNSFERHASPTVAKHANKLRRPKD